MTKEADAAADAFKRLQQKVEEINTKTMDGDELADNFMARLNASEEIAKILNDAREAQRRNGS
jgi:hypothetical protein